jgi:hypothetical protein
MKIKHLIWLEGLCEVHLHILGCRFLSDRSLHVADSSAAVASPALSSNRQQTEVSFAILVWANTADLLKWQLTCVRLIRRHDETAFDLLEAKLIVQDGDMDI